MGVSIIIGYFGDGLYHSLGYLSGTFRAQKTGVGWSPSNALCARTSGSRCLLVQGTIKKPGDYSIVIPKGNPGKNQTVFHDVFHGMIVGDFEHCSNHPTMWGPGSWKMFNKPPLTIVIRCDKYQTIPQFCLMVYKHHEHHIVISIKTIVILLLNVHQLSYRKRGPPHSYHPKVLVSSLPKCRGGQVKTQFYRAFLMQKMLG